MRVDLELPELPHHVLHGGCKECMWSGELLKDGGVEEARDLSSEVGVRRHSRYGGQYLKTRWVSEAEREIGWMRSGSLKPVRMVQSFRWTM